jgi:hypothetical protein
MNRIRDLEVKCFELNAARSVDATRKKKQKKERAEKEKTMNGETNFVRQKAGPSFRAKRGISLRSIRAADISTRERRPL